MDIPAFVILIENPASSLSEAETRLSKNVVCVHYEMTIACLD